MEDTFIKIPLLYFDTFLHKFEKSQSYHWIFSIRNAKVIFSHFQKEANFEDIIFLYVLSGDLDFLNQEAIDILSESETVVDARDLKYFISDKSQTEIVNKFKNHEISNWDFNVILFSCGVACCMNELERSRKNPTRYELDFHVEKGIYEFLLTNRFAIQFYCFLKKKKILLKDKKINLLNLNNYLELVYQKPDFNLSQFLENFILVWDLLECPHEEFLELKKDINKVSDIRNLIVFVHLKQRKLWKIEN